VLGWALNFTPTPTHHRGTLAHCRLHFDILWCLDLINLCIQTSTCFWHVTDVYAECMCLLRCGFSLLVLVRLHERHVFGSELIFISRQFVFVFVSMIYRWYLWSWQTYFVRNMVLNYSDRIFCSICFAWNTNLDLHCLCLARFLNSFNFVSGCTLYRISKPTGHPSYQVFNVFVSYKILLWFFAGSVLAV